MMRILIEPTTTSGTRVICKLYWGCSYLQKTMEAPYSSKCCLRISEANLHENNSTWKHKSMMIPTVLVKCPMPISMGLGTCMYIYICHFCLYLKSSSWDARTSRSMANQQNEQQEKSVRKLQLHPSVAKEQWFEPRLFSKPSFRIAEFDICGPWLWEGNVDFESIHSVLSHNSSQHSWRHTSGLLQEDHKVDLGWIWSPKKQTGNGWNKRCDLQLFS